MRAPRILSSLSLSLFVMTAVGCSDDETGPGPPTTIEISGSIAANASWSGTVRLTANADILPGVVISVAEGTAFQAAQDAALTVHGSLSIDGTAAHPVSMEPFAGATQWTGIVVESGGVAAIHHANGSKVATLLSCKTGALPSLIDSAVFSDLGQALVTSSTMTVSKCDFHDMGANAVLVEAGGHLTITDCFIAGASGDLVVVFVGTLIMSYCDLGAPITTEHGNLFINGAAGLNVTYCNIIGAPYGMMIGGTNGAIVQFSNFLLHEVDVDPLSPNTAVDLSYNYWDSGPPSLGGEYTFNNTSPVPIASAGPRN